MVKFKLQLFQHVPRLSALYLSLMVFLICQPAWAAQEAMVIVDRAVIYSDREMTSPIGYISRGKKLMVGEIPRNKAQVFPVVVSGKVAYIRTRDVTTEKESMDASRLTAERFKNVTEKDLESKFVLSYYSFGSQLSLSHQNGELAEGDALLWHGISFKGEALVTKNFDFQILANYMLASSGEEEFNVFEFGAGGAYRLINHRRFLLRLEGQAMVIPWSTYELGTLFRVRSFGLTLGGGLNATYLWNKNWGVEAFGGAYYTKLMEFDAPEPYQAFSASFVGGRFGVGINYTY